MQDAPIRTARISASLGFSRFSFAMSRPIKSYIVKKSKLIGLGLDQMPRQRISRSEVDETRECKGICNNTQLCYVMQLCRVSTVADFAKFHSTWTWLCSTSITLRLLLPSSESCVSRRETTYKNGHHVISPTCQMIDLSVTITGTLN